MSSGAPIRFEQLRKSYGQTVAVQDFSLEVHPGEIFGMIGPDGAGKTTAMRVACGLLLPESGHVFIAGFDSATETARIKEHLGYMPQRFSLYPDLSVAENLRFFADMYHVPEAERAERENRLMQFSRLESLRKRRAGKLSGGMKQKLALSCILIHTPDVLILDEPTTGVDPISRQEFWQILQDLASEGRAILVSTPYMDEALLCHRVALVHQGRIIAQGTPDEATAQFRRRLLEVSGPDLDNARKILNTLTQNGVAVNRFGDRLHVAFDTGEQAQKVDEVLSGIRVDKKEIEPTIEDAFVELMGSAPDGQKETRSHRP